MYATKKNDACICHHCRGAGGRRRVVLCNHGTADLLKLSGSKREQWTKIANRYNERVEAATQDLLKEAKTLLSPEELAQVQNWLDKARNAELNKLLAAK